MREDVSYCVKPMPVEAFRTVPPLRLGHDAQRQRGTGQREPFSPARAVRVWGRRTQGREGGGAASRVGARQVPAHGSAASSGRAGPYREKTWYRAGRRARARARGRQGKRASERRVPPRARVALSM